MKPAIKHALDALKASAPNGLLTTDILISAARDKRHPLHAVLNWNPQEALKRSLETEARALIREYYVVISTPVGPIKTRHFVSLRHDRANGGGYRTIADVLDDEDLTAQLMEDALLELESLMARYRKLEQLAGVFREIDAAREKFVPQPKRGRKRGPPEARAAA